MSKISGNISAGARIIIINESDWVVESNTTETGGAFEIDGLSSGSKMVISRAASGESTGYGNVNAIDLVVNINLASGQTTPSEDSTLNFTVTFSDPVTDFSEANVDLSGTAGATTAVVTGSGETYNVGVSGMTSTGTVIVTINYSGAVAGPSEENEISYTPPAPSTVLHTAMIFSNRDNDGYITAWNSTWNGARTASTGGEIGVGGYNSEAATQGSKTGLSGDYAYMVSRSFTEFNLSSLSSSDRTFQSAILQVGGFGYNESNVSLFEGTQQSPPVAGDFDSFVNSDDPLANIVTWGLWESDTSVKSNIFTLNAGGNSYVSGKMGSTAKFCFREYSSDRDGPAPTGNKRNGMHYSWQDPQQNNTTHEYFHVGPLLKVSYMKIPVWTSIFDNTKWQPYGNNANAAVWTGSSWTAGSWGSIDLQIKSGQTWNSNYKPNKMKITFTGPSTVDLYLYSNKSRALIGNNTGMSITSGQEVVIPWNYPDANIIELYLDSATITVTNIQFLER
jgi:hypothetical protein